MPLKETDLRDTVCRVLPPSVLALLETIEEFARLSIEFKPNQTPAARGAFNPDAAQVDVRHNSATVYLRNLDKIDARGVAHELLHVRRYWLDGVPQLRPVKENEPARNRYMQTIENEIEHMTIIPHERMLGLADESIAYWNETARKKWAEYPWSDLPDAASRRDYALSRISSLNTSGFSNTAAH